MTIFHFAHLPVNTTFGVGLSAPERAPRRSPFSTLDQAWHAGFTAGREDGASALPPDDMTDDQTFAWLQGRESAVIGGDEGADWDHGQLEALAEQAELQELHERGIKVF